MNAPALEAALRQIGLSCTVTADGPVALVRVAPDDTALGEPATRRAAVALAAEHGFRNIALEVAD